LRTHENKIKHGIAVLCLDVIVKLRGSSEKKLSWHGPTTKGANGFPKESILPLVLSGLAGLTFYIKLEEETMINSWDPAIRNNVAHDGAFLSSLYASVDRNNRAEAYGAQKRKVKTLRKAYEVEAAKDNIPANIDEGVSNVVEALGEKNIMIAGGEEDAVRKGLKFIAEEVNK